MGFFIRNPKAFEGLHNSHLADGPKGLQESAYVPVNTTEMGTVVVHMI